jgi:hypothetical protein
LGGRPHERMEAMGLTRVPQSCMSVGRVHLLYCPCPRRGTKVVAELLDRLVLWRGRPQCLDSDAMKRRLIPKSEPHLRTLPPYIYPPPHTSSLSALLSSPAATLPSCIGSSRTALLYLLARCTTFPPCCRSLTTRLRQHVVASRRRIPWVLSATG